MKGIKIILKKELSRVFGDKRLMFSLFVLPAIMMIAMYGIMGMMSKNQETDIKEHIPTVYIVNAPESLEKTMTATGYKDMADVISLTAGEFEADKDLYENNVLEGSVELIVEFDKDFTETVKAYSKAGDKIPEVKISYNDTENYSNQAYSVFSSVVLSNYRDSLLAERLGNLEQLNVFSQTETKIAKEAKQNAVVISTLLPYLIVMLLFSSAMSIGIDAFAGEKERGTLTSMLISPAKRSDIVLGKIFSLSITTSITAVIYAISMIVALSLLGGDTASVFNFKFSVVQGIQLVSIMIVIVLLYVAVIGLLSTMAKDAKSAASYVAPMYIVVIVAGVLTMFGTGKEIPFYKYMIPVYGNALAIKDVCVNELTAANFAGTICGTLLVAIVVAFGLVKAFKNEKIMFNA